MRTGRERACAGSAILNETLLVEGVEAGAYAHAVMPGGGENPPDERAENGLTNDEGNDVAFAEEEPAHHDATHEGQRHQDRIWPVERGENRAGQEGRSVRRFDGVEKPVRQIRIQRDLLQDAKGRVGEEAPGLGDVKRQSVVSTGPETHHARRENKRGVNQQPLPGCGPQIVDAPAQRFRGVAMQKKAGRKPDGENDPASGSGLLKVPDVPGNISG